MIPNNVTFIVADTETTDATPERKICEVGWAVVDLHCNILSEHQSLIDPERPIGASASGIHNLTNEDVANSPTIEEYFSADDPSCYGKKIQGPVVVIGHRISFDIHTMAPYIDGELYELCTLRWVRRLYPHADDHKLATMMYALGLPRPEGAHRVMSDVHSALHLVKHIATRNNLNLLELARASQEPFMLEVFPMGKHKGELFSAVPKPYLRWAKDNVKDMDQDFNFTVDHYLNKSKPAA